MPFYNRMNSNDFFFIKESLPLTGYEICTRDVEFWVLPPAVAIELLSPGTFFL